MNDKASQLGLTHTHFETPHGLDSENHYTTAYELALLSNYAMQNKTFATIVNTKICTITINGYSKTIHNTNELLGNVNGVYGIKTGFTNGANRCLVSCCKRGNMDVICVVLGADTKNFRTKDSIVLLEYTFQNFEPTNIEQIAKEEFVKWKEQHLDDFIIEKSLPHTICFDMSKLKHSTIPLNKDKMSSICVDIQCQTNFIAPIEVNHVIGKLTIKMGEQIVDTVPILLTESIGKKTMWNYMNEFFRNFLTYFENFY